MLALPPKAKLPNATSMPNIQHNKKMGKPPSEAQKKYNLKHKVFT